MPAIKIQCPVCKGKHLGVNTDTGAFQCFTSHCDSGEILRKFPFVYGQSLEAFLKTFRSDAVERPTAFIKIDPEGLYTELYPSPLVCGEVYPQDEETLYPEILLENPEQILDIGGGVIWHYYGDVLESYLHENGGNNVLGTSWVRRVYYEDESGHRKKVLHPFFEDEETKKLVLGNTIHPKQLYGLHRWSGGNFTFVVEGEMVTDWVLNEWEIPAVSIPAGYYNDEEALIVALQALRERNIEYIGIIPDADDVGFGKALMLKEIASYTGLTCKVASKEAVIRFPRELDLDVGNQIEYTLHEFALREL